MWLTSESSIFKLWDEMLGGLNNDPSRVSASKVVFLMDGGLAA